jgi:hypothetical protein
LSIGSTVPSGTRRHGAPQQPGRLWLLAGIQWGKCGEHIETYEKNMGKAWVILLNMFFNSKMLAKYGSITSKNGMMSNNSWDFIDLAIKNCI